MATTTYRGFDGAFGLSILWSITYYPYSTGTRFVPLSNENIA
jgi:hypothetical protein